MTIYVEIKDDPTGNRLIVDVEQAKQILEQEVLNLECNSECFAYIFKPVEMTDEEYKALPEFQGF